MQVTNHKEGICSKKDGWKLGCRVINEANFETFGDNPWKNNGFRFTENNKNGLFPDFYFNLL